MSSTTLPSEFPYSLYAPLPIHHNQHRTNNNNHRTISLPLPSTRLASAALNAIQVDAELSPAVRRIMTLSPKSTESKDGGEGEKTVLQTTYRATTNRMLRVSVNGFMESLRVVLGVMEELDVDVLAVGDVGEEGE